MHTQGITDSHTSDLVLIFGALGQLFKISAKQKQANGRVIAFFKQVQFKRELISFLRKSHYLQTNKLFKHFDLKNILK